MKRIPVQFLFITLMLTMTVSSFVWATPQIGQPAPEFKAVDSHGKTHNLSDFKGSIVVLEWTNHDCPFVQKHYSSGNMQALQKEATANQVVWLSVISSAPGKQGHVSATEANELTTARNAAPTAVLLDPEGTVGKLYGARTTPHMYVIDKEGILVYMGGIDDIPSADPSDIPKSTNYVRAALKAMNEGKPIEVASSRPYGCSVKY